MWCSWIFSLLLCLATAGRVQYQDEASNGRSLTVRLELAQLPIGKSQSQPEVTARVANREYKITGNAKNESEADFWDAAVFRIPLKSSDGSLMLTLKAGRRKMGKVKVTLRQEIFKQPEKWLSFQKSLDNGAGQLVFKVYYHTGQPTQELPSSTASPKRPRKRSKGGGAKDYHAGLDENSTGELSGPAMEQPVQTLNDLATFLHRVAGDVSRPWCREDDSNRRVYFALQSNGVEVCFFFGSQIEVQMCRSSKLHVGMRSEIDDQGFFEIPLNSGVMRGGDSSVSGKFADQKVLGNRVVFADADAGGSRSEYVYTDTCELVPTTTSTLFNWGEEEVHVFSPRG